MNIKYHINRNMTTLYQKVLTLRIMRLAHEPADAAGICCVANHTAGLIQDTYGDNRFKEPLDLAFIYESAFPIYISFMFTLLLSHINFNCQVAYFISPHPSQ